jgi:hypothetical protein
MQKHIAKFVLAALLAATPVVHAVERLSSDETAIRMGVEAWLNAWSTNAERPDSRYLPKLYSADLRVSKTVPPKPAVLAPFDRWTAKRADDLMVVMRGGQATTTFTFVPEGVDQSGQPLKTRAQVILVWERRDGFWQIVRQQTTAATGVALSASGR